MRQIDRDVEAATLAAERATAAVSAARAHVDALAPRTLNDEQKPIRRRLVRALGYAERGHRGGWSTLEPSWIVIYEEAGKALRQLERLERTALEDEQRRHVADAVSLLHRAEDEIRDAYWNSPR